jgi:hypothetical protein
MFSKPEKQQQAEHLPPVVDMLFNMRYKEIKDWEF